MDAHLAQELLNELGSSLENLETQQAALLQLLKGQGIVTDKQLAPYLNEAGNASSVRWRAARVRLEHIFSAAERKEQQTAKPEEHQTAARQTPDKQEKDKKQTAKSANSDIQPVEKVQTKEEKAGNGETTPQARGDGSKLHHAEHEPSRQSRDEDAA